MIDVVKVASYICSRYKEEKKTDIEGMDLQRFLYLSQREAFIRKGEPMFEDSFLAWEQGPVINKVYDMYERGELNIFPTEDELSPFQESLDFIFQNYGSSSSCTLDILTRGESSWRNARKGCEYSNQCGTFLDLNDIKRDARRMKFRRFFFTKVVPILEERGLWKPYV